MLVKILQLGSQSYFAAMIEYIYWAQTLLLGHVHVCYMSLQTLKAESMGLDL